MTIARIVLVILYLGGSFYIILSTYQALFLGVVLQESLFAVRALFLVSLVSFWLGLFYLLTVVFGKNSRENSRRKN